MMRHSLKEKLVINKHYSHIKYFIKKLPDIFHKEGNTLFGGRNIIKTFDLDERICLNVKSFKTPHLLNQFVYATFRESKAKRSYYYAKTLLDLGIDTPEPIAYMEFSKPLRLINSLYVSEHIDIDGELKIMKYGTVDEHRELITSFARFTTNLHSLNILHLDYSSGNVIFKKEGNAYKFYLVDLNRMKFNKKISFKTAAHNFRRLWGSDDMIALFAKEYATIRHFNVQKFQSEVFKHRTKFWTEFNKKHPNAIPYKE